MLMPAVRHLFSSGGTEAEKDVSPDDAKLLVRLNDLVKRANREMGHISVRSEDNFIQKSFHDLRLSLQTSEKELANMTDALKNIMERITFKPDAQTIIKGKNEFDAEMKRLHQIDNNSIDAKVQQAEDCLERLSHSTMSSRSLASSDASAKGYIEHGVKFSLGDQNAEQSSALVGNEREGVLR